MSFQLAATPRSLAHSLTVTYFILVLLAQKKFKEVQYAYEILSDKQERAWYDSHRAEVLQAAAGVEQETLSEFTTVCCLRCCCLRCFLSLVSVACVPLHCVLRCSSDTQAWATTNATVAGAQSEQATPALLCSLQRNVSGCV